ncbi:MAG: hypothetical protein AB1467_06595 [Candidatus Diapherotrites archaeon]
MDYKKYKFHLTIGLILLVVIISAVFIYYLPTKEKEACNKLGITTMSMLHVSKCTDNEEKAYVKVDTPYWTREYYNESGNIILKCGETYDEYSSAEYMDQCTKFEKALTCNKRMCFNEFEYYIKYYLYYFFNF